MATDSDHLLLLLNWMSPAFPTGSYAYSHGLEQAITDGRVASTEDAAAWIADLLRSGSGWNDAVLFVQCFTRPIEALNELALALAGSSERFLETTHLGRNFAVASAAWTGIAPPDTNVAYPVAAGLACKTMGISQGPATMAFLQGSCAALISVAVRLVPLGQTNGLIMLRDLAPLIANTAQRAAAAGLEELGSCCVVSDIASMQHEMLESRIYRT